MRSLEAVALLILSLSVAACAKSEPPGSGPKVAVVDETDRLAPDRIVTGSISTSGTVSGPFTIEPGVETWYQERGVALPVTDTLGYCHGFGCEFKTRIPMGDAEYGALAAIFDRHKSSPEDERVGINLADQWWEKHSAPLLGGPTDKRGSELGDAHKPGQTDCVDEATNTTTLLVYLERKGLMRFHHVRRPESRGAFLYAHATAVMRDKATGVDWIADSWMRDSGDPIDVMTLERWFSLAYVDPTE